jgi:uncharacterized protein with NAD-binding domain and iron-sulfur cluster
MKHYIKIIDKKHNKTVQNLLFQLGFNWTKEKNRKKIIKLSANNSIVLCANLFDSNEIQWSVGYKPDWVELKLETLQLMLAISDEKCDTCHLNEADDCEKEGRNW